MADIYLTQNRRLPVLHAVLRDYSGIFDLSTASAVKLVAMDSGGVNKINTACTIVNPSTAGEVTYAWAAADVDTPGTYFAKFMATIGGQDLPFPSDGYLTIQINEDPV